MVKGECSNMKVERSEKLVSVQQLVFYLDLTEEEYWLLLDAMPGDGYDDAPGYVTVGAWNGLSNRSFTIRVNGRGLTDEDKKQWRAKRLGIK